MENIEVMLASPKKPTIASVIEQAKSVASQSADADMSEQQGLGLLINKFFGTEKADQRNGTTSLIWTKRLKVLKSRSARSRRPSTMPCIYAPKRKLKWRVRLTNRSRRPNTPIHPHRGIA